VAHTLGLPLDIFVVRKLEVPGLEELAMGTVASDGTVAINSAIIQKLRISEEAIEAEVERAKLEIKRQENTYRNGRPPARIEGRMAILVDDGLASGASMLPAVRALRPNARKVIVAVPVAANSTCNELRNEVDSLFAREYRGRFTPCGASFGISSRLQMKMSALCCQRPATIRKHCGQLKGASVLMARSRMGG
jgi:putative phosphoribosyl transferase